LLQPDFHNDAFSFLVPARQIILGEIPGHDFIGGRSLRVYFSAALQAMFGYQLLPEALVEILFIAAGTLLTYRLATEAAGSIVTGLCVTSMAVAIYPRLYNYPKVFFFVLGLWACWKYVDHHTPARLFVLACCTVGALLFRYDHGALVGVAALTTLLTMYWETPRSLLRSLAFYGVFVVFLWSPYFFFLSLHGGVVNSFRNVAAFIQPELVRTQLPWPTFVASLSPGMSVPQVFVKENATPYLYYCFITLPILVLLKIRVQQLWLWSASRRLSPDLPKILCTITLCAAADSFMLRAPLASRLADVAAPTAVLAAWLIGPRLGWSSVSRRLDEQRQEQASDSTPNDSIWRSSLLYRTFRFAWILGLLVITWLSISVVGDLPVRIERTGIASGAREVWTRLVNEIRGLSVSPPIDRWAPMGSTGLKGLVRYVYECTKPSDRLLVTWFAPEVYFYSGRGFAGGIPVFAYGYWATKEVQQRTLAKLSAQAVPIVLLNLQVYENFQENFAPVHAYFMTYYQAVKDFPSGEESNVIYRVLVDRRRVPSGLYEPLALPCFR
jgi:hypothetical protein